MSLPVKVKRKRKADIIRIGSSILPIQQTNTMQIKINTTTLAQHKLVVKLLALLDYKVYDGSATESYSERSYISFPIISVDLRIKEFSGRGLLYIEDSLTWATEAAHIMELLQKPKPKQYKVTLYQETYTDVIIYAGSAKHAEELVMEGEFDDDDIDDVTVKDSDIITVMEEE